MKKVLTGILAITFSILGLQKLADKLDTGVKSKAIESDRMIAGNGGGLKGRNGGLGPKDRNNV